MENENAAQQQKNEPIFALDIGTHNVIGIVGQSEGSQFHIAKIHQMEYSRRAMKDGQIEDIEEVAETAGKVRRMLEEDLGIELHEVYVAAAGRALRTQKASYEINLETNDPINSQQVAELEMCAIQQAEEELLAGEQPNIPLCYVGHSVIQYYLDDYPMSPLQGHRGKKMKADIIATFLPGEVVDSLYASMGRCGLKVSNITLEPIAAMNAIIPHELRMLNLVLVDIGAGTSDIAISEGGSVVAYTMATVAGDEITEAIVQSCLVDFHMAEQMKFSLSEGAKSIHYEDILGFSYKISAADLKEKVQPAVENLCSEICGRILEINGKAPAAVFMVGGGSKLDGLCGLVAKGLSMMENKVAVGGNNYMKRMVISEENVSGPEFATPVGIAITAMTNRNNRKYSVTLNRKPIQIMAREPANVMELLLLNGYERNQLLGRSGKSLTFEVDGEKRVVRGGRPTAATVLVNGQAASITTPVRPNDEITMEPAVTGQDASITVEQAVEGYQEILFRLNGQSTRGGTIVTINGAPVDGNRMIRELDVLKTRHLVTLEDLCRERRIDPSCHRFTVNQLPQGLGYTIVPDDEVHYEWVAVLEHKEEEAAPQQPVEEKENTIKIRLNGEVLTLRQKHDKSSYLFVDMLNYVDIDPSKPQGNIVLRINGRTASYVEEVRDGDEVEIYWDTLRTE
jgi:cell division protein FtsA